MTSPRHSLRNAILACLEASPCYLTAQEVSQRTGIPYKAVIDALYALHNKERIARNGRKYSAKWGSTQLQANDDRFLSWRLLAATWFGRGIAL